jgi:hypothetical protein
VGGEIILKDTLSYGPRPLFRIRIGFNAVSDPDFYLNVDPDPDPGSQTNADPDSEPGKFCRHKKLDFDMKIKLYCCTVGSMSYNIPIRVKHHFEKPKIRFICSSWSISLFLDPEPDPGEPNQCGSGYGYVTLTEIVGNCNTQLFQVSKAGKNKSKSAHDLAKDPSLASDVGGLTQVL